MQLDLPARRGGRAIGLTPLIDVVFILLLFFLLASHFHQWRVLQLDTAMAAVTETSADASQPPAVLLRVQVDGTLDINGTAVELAGLQAVLDQYRARRADLSVVIAPNSDVRLQALVNVIDAVAAAGIERVSLQ